MKQKIKHQCPECNYTKEIRNEVNIDLDGTIINYLRCKRCGYQWENHKYIAG